ncbi:universal stress protein [Alteromonas sp. MMG017]|uniref:universal stress protein n=1 Tax=Alteromonas sp. MMG017 TaxID=2822692 RepID=UPI001B3A22DE|nr:universal stress protein [Alteromonas sp. MMG017]MBQ4830036.1 universal stress protein [Alteromonas sp. MMG017]
MDKIMTCIDGSGMTPAVVKAGKWAANKLAKPLCFLHTIEKTHQHGADDYTGAIGLGARSSLLEEMTKLDEQKSKLALQFGSELLESAVSEAQSTGIETAGSILRHGDIVEAIIEIENEIRLIVIGRKGVGHDNEFKAIGSHLETLLRKASQPVLIVPEEFSAPTSFMIAYDGRESADRALQKVLDGGLLYGIDCHLVAIKNNEPGLKAKFDNAASQLAERGLNVSTALLEGNIKEELVKYQKANNIDLLVMGAFGHSRLRQLFVGSNTIKMLETTNIPLIVLR